MTWRKFREATHQRKGTRAIMSRLGKVATHILVCRHKSCEKSGARLVVKEIRATLKEHGWRRRVIVSNVGCLDQCSHASMVCLYPQGVWYEKVDTETAREIVEEYVIGGRQLKRHLLHDFNEVRDESEENQASEGQEITNSK